MNRSFHPYFEIIGQFDPDVVTLQLGLEPSWVERIGDPGPPGALGPRLGALWRWQPLDDESHDVGDQLAYMAGALSLRRDEVASLSRKFRGTFYVFQRQGVVLGNWFVSADTLRMIAALQVHVACEHVLPEDSA